MWQVINSSKKGAYIIIFSSVKKIDTQNKKQENPYGEFCVLDKWRQTTKNIFIYKLKDSKANIHSEGLQAKK